MDCLNKENKLHLIKLIHTTNQTSEGEDLNSHLYMPVSVPNSTSNSGSNLGFVAQSGENEAERGVFLYRKEKSLKIFNKQTEEFMTMDCCLAFYENKNDLIINIRPLFAQEILPKSSNILNLMYITFRNEINLFF
jgi:hypothetical protein